MEEKKYDNSDFEMLVDALKEVAQLQDYEDYATGKTYKRAKAKAMATVKQVLEIVDENYGLLSE